jgi:hypothetical protein
VVKLPVSVLSLTVFALVVIGCSTGGGGGAGASTGAASVASGASTRAAAYGWTTQPVGTAPGAVSALAAVASGQVLAAEAPARQVVAVDPTGGRTVEGGFAADVCAFATDPSGALHAATSDAAVAGAGDVWERSPAGWRVVVDGPGTHAATASANGLLHAVLGGAAGPAQVQVRSAQGWLALGVLPSDGAPTAAAAFGIDLWVGTEGPAGAGLFRVVGNAITHMPLPVPGVGPGAAQRVTALVAMPDALAIAVGTFDASGQPLGGHVVLWSDPAGFREVLGLGQDAPLALAKQDGTLYVGTAAGRLLYQTPSGFVDEAGLPPNGGVHALLALDPSTLLVGVAGPSGAELLRRTALSAPGGGGGGGAGGTPDYLHVAKAILASRCAGCHATMQTGWRVSQGMTADQADFQATLAEVDTTSPDASLLLTKASNQVVHGGGALLPTTSPDFVALRGWIQAGAPFDTGASAGTGAGTGTGTGTGTTTPAGTTPDYLHEAKAILAPRCSGCHSTMTTGWRVSPSMASDTTDYQATLGEVNTTTPGASVLLTKATNQAAHSGGALIATTSPEYATLLAWIQNGAQYDTPRTGTPTPPRTRLTYLLDAKPILFACVGCHTSESPRLSPGLTQDASDYQSVLGKVNLGTPASSELLRKPSSTNDHPVKVFDVGSIQHDTLLRWIQQGAVFN